MRDHQILGSDGQPITDPEDINVLMIEAKRALQDNETALLVHAMTQAHQIYQFARAELETKNLSPDVLQVLVESSTGKATKGFTIQQLVRSLKKKTVPFLEHKMANFRKEENKRKEQAKKIERALPPVGFRMPLKSMQDKVERFTLSSAFVVAGKDHTGQMGLLQHTAKHFKDQEYRVAYLSGADYTPDKGGVPWATMLMPASWWAGAAASAQTFAEALAPVAEQDMQFLFVENLSVACGVQDSFESMRDWTQRAMALLVSWCKSKRVALFMGLDVSQCVDPDNLETDFPFLADIPYVVARSGGVEGTDGVLMHVIVENDTVPLEDDDGE